PCRKVGDSHFHRPPRIARIILLGLRMGSSVKVADGNSAEIRVILQRRVKREANVVPDGDVSGGASFLGEMAAFEVPEVADVVDRRVLAGFNERRLAGRRQRRSFGKEWIED